MTDTEREHLTAGEAARLLGVAVVTIRQWANRGHLHPIRVDPRRSLYLRSELLALQASPPRRSGRPKKERSR